MRASKIGSNSRNRTGQGTRRRPRRNRKRTQRAKQRRNKHETAPSEQARRDESMVTSGLVRHRLEEQLYYDPRASLSTQIDLYADNMNSVIPYRVPIDATSLAAPILAAVSYAIQRGWALSSNLPSDPYHATIYMVEMLIACVKNETPQIMDVPVWLHYLCQSVTERKVKSRGGQLDYSFELIESFAQDYEIPIGLSESYRYILGVKGTTIVNEVFRATAPPVAYTNELGERAAQSMWLYLAAYHADSPMHKLIAINKTNKVSRTASPYAVLLPGPGGGFEGTGGWNKRLQLEVPVDFPLFSCFKTATLTDDNEDNSRAPLFLRNFTGDGFLLGGMLTYKLMPYQLKLKNPPNIHFVDFNELLDVLALSVQLAIARRLEDSDTRENLANDPNYYVDNIQCPLTLQEVGMILRYTVMAAFDDSQLCGQSLYPRARIGNLNEFASFVCGINTAPQSGATNMRIPLLLKENVLALRERVINAGRSGAANPLVWMPILGQYENDRLEPESYCNTIDETEYPAFFFNQQEVPVSYIDGSSGKEFVWINDPGALIPIIEQWNNWTVKMANYYWTMDTIGSDMGIDPLFSGCMTRHWLNIEPRTAPPVPTRRKSQPKLPPVPKKRFERLRQQDGIYGSRKALAVSCYVPPFKSAWEGVQQFFVLPINKIGPAQPGDPTTFTSYQRIAAFRGETYQIPLGSGEGNFVTLADLHFLMATQMVKTKFAEVDMTQKVIEKLGENGDAGILSSIVASLAGKIIPGVGPVAEAIANVVPF